MNLGVSVIVRVTLKDGTYHEVSTDNHYRAYILFSVLKVMHQDIGYGQMQNALNRAAALEKVRQDSPLRSTNGSDLTIFHI